MSESLVEEVGGVEVAGAEVAGVEVAGTCVEFSAVFSVDCEFGTSAVVSILSVVVVVLVSSVVSSFSGGLSSAFAVAPFCFVLALGFVFVVDLFFLRCGLANDTTGMSTDKSTNIC